MSAAAQPDAGAIVLRDGLVLLAPGGLFVPAESALIVSDLHVGYTATLRARGYGVPVAPDDELLARLRGMLARSGARRLVVAGDLVHGAPAARAGVAGPSPLAAFVAAVAPHEVTVVLGNHDRRVAGALAALGIEPTETARVGPHVVDHGDDAAHVRAARAEAQARGGRVVIGHLHPALVLDDSAGAHAKVPAFVTAPGLVCLPALTPLARGGDVRSAALRAQLGALAPLDEMGVAAVVGARVVPVGSVFRGDPRSRRSFTRTKRDGSEGGDRG